MNNYAWLKQIHSLSEDDLISLSQKLDFIEKTRREVSKQNFEAWVKETNNEKDFDDFMQSKYYLCECYYQFVNKFILRDAMTFCFYHFGKPLDVDQCPCKCKCECCTKIIN